MFKSTSSASGLGSLAWDNIGNGNAGLFKATMAPPPPPPKCHPPPCTNAAASPKPGESIRPAYTMPQEYGGGWVCANPNPPISPIPPGRFESCNYEGTNLALWDRNQSVVLLFSAMAKFDSLMQARINATFELRTGVPASIKSVPAGAKFESLVYVGSNGINAAYRDWGDVLLTVHNRTRSKPDASIVLSHLGFSSTGGYFYSPQGAQGTWPHMTPGKNFEQTMLDVHAYAQREAIPYRSLLLDSWWYGEYSHNGSGMMSWDESSAKGTDDLDPGGRFPHGLKWLHSQLGGVDGMGNFIQHMGHWRGDTIYVNQNPDWDWRVYTRGDVNSLYATAWTNSQSFYDSLFLNATEWGLVTAKHDHVQQQIPTTDAAMDELGYTASVLTAELKALEKVNATMMAGGYTMLGWMNGLTSPAITHARVANDYACWYNASTGVGDGCSRGMNTNYWSFNSGPPALLSWALGMFPYKDSFFSSDARKGPHSCIAGSCLFANWTEPYPYVHALAAALSAGPVAPADLINASNRSLIMMTCREDGLLLKPDRPATSIDSYWMVRAFGNSVPRVNGPRGELWTTETTISGITWMYAFGTMLDETYNLMLDELLVNANNWGERNSKRSSWLATPARFVAYDFIKGANSVHLFSDGRSHRKSNLQEQQTLRFKAGIDYGAASYYVVAPILTNGWAVLGETAKFVPIAKQRISKVDVALNSITVHISGQQGEVVTFAALAPGHTVPSYFSVTVSANGTAQLAILPAVPQNSAPTTKMLPTYQVNVSTAFDPPPQSVEQPASSPTVSVGPEWIIAANLSNEANVFAATNFAEALFDITGGAVRYSILDTKALKTQPPEQPSKFVAFGAAASDSVVAAQLALRNGSLPRQLGPVHSTNHEAYVMQVSINAVVIAGVGDAGAFYGLQTLKQLWNASWTAGGGSCVAYCQLPEMSVSDWPDLALRGAHIHQLGSKALSPVFFEQADKMAAHKMNMFSAMTTEDITSIHLDKSANFLLAMQKYVTDRHMEFVPVLGLGVNLLADSRTAEGIWSKDLPCTVQESSLELASDTPAVLPLANPSFELDDPQWLQAPLSWKTYPGANAGSNSSWQLDAKVARTGKRSMKLLAGAGSSTSASTSARLLSMPVSVEPMRTYQLSMFAKPGVRAQSASTTGFLWAWIVQLDLHGQEISGVSHLPTGAEVSNLIPDADGWSQVTTNFVSDPMAVQFAIYIGKPGNASDDFECWIDDLMLLDLDAAFSNVIRTSITDFVVRPRNSSNTSLVYQEGVDYVVQPALDPVTVMPNFRATVGYTDLNQNLTARVVALKGGKLNPGDRVVLDYDFQPGSMGFHSYDLWNGTGPHLPWPPATSSYSKTSTSRTAIQKKLMGGSVLRSPKNNFQSDQLSISSDFVEPLYYEIAINTTLSLLQMFAERGNPIKYINLNYDELHSMARDSRSLRSGLSNGQLLSTSINRISKAVKEVHPNVTLLIWDDMLNPFHLHAPGSDQDDLQAQHYGREDGTLDGAMQLVEDTDIVWLNWFYDYPYSNLRINSSLNKSWDLGFRVIGCPNEDFENIQCYASSLLKSTRGLGLGMMDTDWDGKYLGVVRTASVSWHYVPNITLNCG